MTTPITPTASTASPRLRPRGQLLPIAIILVVVAFTLGSAMLNLLPGPRRSTRADELRDELAVVVAQRHERIAALRTAAVECQPPRARELTRLLVLDGQWSLARGYADAYADRCGDDPVVRHWGNAPRPCARRAS